GEGARVAGRREPDERAGAARGRAEEGPADRRENPPDAVLVLAEAGADDARVEAGGVQLGRARGELPREEDVAELGRAVDAHGRIGALGLEVIEVEAPGGV